MNTIETSNSNQNWILVDYKRDVFSIIEEITENSDENLIFRLNKADTISFLIGKDSLDELPRYEDNKVGLNFYDDFAYSFKFRLLNQITSNILYDKNIVDSYYQPTDNTDDDTKIKF